MLQIESRVYGGFIHEIDNKQFLFRPKSLNITVSQALLALNVFILIDPSTFFAPLVPFVAVPRGNRVQDFLLLLDAALLHFLVDVAVAFGSERHLGSQ